MKGILESHIQTLIWIIIGLAIVLIFVWIAVFYLRIIPLRIESI